MQTRLSVAAPAVFGTTEASAAPNTKTSNASETLDISLNMPSEAGGQASANDCVRLQGLSKIRLAALVQAQFSAIKNDGFMRAGYPKTAQGLHFNLPKIRFGMTVTADSSGAFEGLDQFKKACDAVKSKAEAKEVLNRLSSSVEFLMLTKNLIKSAEFEINPKRNVSRDQKQQLVKMLTQLVETLSGINKLLEYLS